MNMHGGVHIEINWSSQEKRVQINYFQHYELILPSVMGLGRDYTVI